MIRRDKELKAKLESVDTSRSAIENSDSRIEELELQLQKYIAEKNDLEIKLEEATQDLGNNISYVSSKFSIIGSY